MCMTRKIRKIDIKSYFHTTAILLKGFFDSVDFELNHVRSRNKTAQSVRIGRHTRMTICVSPDGTDRKRLPSQEPRERVRNE